MLHIIERAKIRREKVLSGKAPKILSIIFLCIGISFAIAAYSIFTVSTVRRNSFEQNATETTATIVEIIFPGGFRQSGEHSHIVDEILRENQIQGATARAFVEYEVNGNRIIVMLNWWSSAMFLGQTMDILVDNDNPMRFMSATTPLAIFILTWVFASLSVMFGGMGIVFLLWAGAIYRRRRYLVRRGIPLWAEVDDISENYLIRINGRPALTLIATHNNMVYESEPLTERDLQQVGEYVKVLIHPYDERKYLVDVKDESGAEIVSDY